MDSKIFAGPTFHTADWPHEVGGFQRPTCRRDRYGLLGGTDHTNDRATGARTDRIPAHGSLHVVPAHNGPLDAAFEARASSPTTEASASAIAACVWGLEASCRRIWCRGTCSERRGARRPVRGALADRRLRVFSVAPSTTSWSMSAPTHLLQSLFAARSARPCMTRRRRYASRPDKPSAANACVLTAVDTTRPSTSHTYAGSWT